MFRHWRPPVVELKNTPWQTAEHASISDNINQTRLKLLVFAVHTWLLYESECVVLCLHHDSVRDRVVFLQERLYVQLEERIIKCVVLQRENTATK